MAEYTHPLGTGLSADQTIVRAYDETNNRHRVDAQVTAVIGAVDVVIDAASGDNIAIRDSDGDELAVNVDGSINVVVQDITLDYTNDSVTVYQGTNPWIVSATDLDIRNLTFAQDKVDVSGSSVSVSNFPATQDVNIVSSVELEIKNDAGNPIPVNGTVELGATTLAALESVTVQNPAGAGAVNIQDGGNSITVDATNLDIRDLVFSTDKVDTSGSTIALDATTLAALESVSTNNGALETTQQSVLTELQTANTSLDAIEADSESIRLETVAINSELDAQTTLLTNIDQSTNDIETATESLNLKFDVNLSTRNAEATQQLVLTELQNLNTSTDNIESDTDNIRIAVQSIDLDFDVALSTRASEATQLNIYSEIQTIDDSLNDIEARLETFDTNNGSTTINTLRTSSNITDEAGAAFTDANYLPVGQSTHDNLNLNANLQLNNTDVSNTNPVPVSGNVPTGTNTIMPVSGVEPGNSTTTLLGAGGIFTGTWFNAENFVSIDVLIKTDVNSAVDGAAVDYSYDGVSITRTIVATVVGSSNGIYFSVPREAKFFRVRYTNGASPQTNFTLQTLLSSTVSGLAAIPIGASITSSTTALISRSVITGEGPESGIYINKKATAISTLNTTSANLGSGATFTGPWEDVSGYATISVLVKSDVASATDGLKLELSADGITVHNDDVYTIPANSGKVFSVPAFGKFFRVRYVNSGTAQTSFTLQTKYFVDYPKPSSHRIDNAIISQDDAELVKAVITGQRPDGSFTNIDTTTAGNLKVSIQEFDPAVFGQETMANSLPVVIASDQSTINVNTEGVVATQTTTNLGSAGVYTSASIDTKDFGTIIVSSFSNVAGSFTVEWSIDQVTWRSDGDIYTTAANTLKTSTYGPKYRYVRGVYTNGGTAQTTFEFQIVLKRNHTKPSSHKASEAFNDSTDLEGVKAVVAGKAPNGTYVNWMMTNGGSGKVALLELDAAVASSVGGRLILETANYSRLPEIRSRTAIHKNINASGAATIHTVTVGKTFYMTGFMVSAVNTGAANANLQIRDGASTVKVPFTWQQMPALGQPQPFVQSSPALEQNPMPFTTDVRTVHNAGTLVVSLTIWGYEE